MSVEYFDEQRRQLIAAIRADTNEVTNRIGKTARCATAPALDFSF